MGAEGTRPPAAIDEPVPLPRRIYTMRCRLSTVPSSLWSGTFARGSVTPRPSFMSRRRYLLLARIRTFVRWQAISLLLDLFPVLTSRHQIVYVLMYENDPDP